MKYDLENLGRSLSREMLSGSLRIYREFLPVVDSANVVSLGETMTPLVPAPKLGQNDWIKDEGQLPTGQLSTSVQQTYHQS